MTKLLFEDVDSLILEKNAIELQEKINSGLVWEFGEDAIIDAVNVIKFGLCMLGEKTITMPDGQYIPSRDEVREGEVGSRTYCKKRLKMMEEDGILRSAARLYKNLLEA